MLTRRMFLSAAAGVPAFTGSSLRAWAATTFEAGPARIDTLSDGNLVLPGGFIFDGMPEAGLSEIITRYGLSRDQLTPPCNVTLYRDGTNTVLFDVGAGGDFQPTAGKLMEALALAGVAPDDVTHVLFTHAHPDHIWGLLDEFDEPVFANAEYMIGADEMDYWLDPDTVNTIGEARTTFAVGAKRRLEAISEIVRRLQDGEEALSGIAAHLTPGHTPGHMSFEVAAGSESVMVVGDAIGNHHVAFEQPGWGSGSDQDKDLGAVTRTRLLDRLAAEKMRFIGFHLPDGGMGFAEKAGAGYRFAAAG